MEAIGKVITWILISSFIIINCQLNIVQSAPSLGASELSSIDGYVSSGLFGNSNGFIYHSGMGPVIVEGKNPNTVTRDGLIEQAPTSSYYRSLPSVIPEGYEGVASSSFLLGHPITTQFPSSSSSTSTTSYSTPTTTTYSSSGPTIYQQQHQQSPSTMTYSYSSNLPQSYQSQSQQSFTYSSAPSSPSPSPLSSNQFQFQTQQPQFQQQTTFQPLQQQQQQQQYFTPTTRSGGYQLPQQQQPQQLQQSQQYNDAQSSNSIENSFKPDSTITDYGYDRSLVPTNYIGGTGIRSRDELILNPVLEQTLSFEDQLPEHLRNPFYSNSLLASMLAQESLPAQGERVVGNWNTNKIREGKIRDLLNGAGFLAQSAAQQSRQ